MIRLLLKKASPERREYCLVAHGLWQYYSRVTEILQQDSIRDNVILRIDTVVPRIQELFNISKTEKMESRVEDLLQGLIRPLLRPHSEMISADQAFELTGSALSALIKNPSPYLCDAAVTILKVDDLLEKLIAHEQFDDGQLAIVETELPRPRYGQGGDRQTRPNVLPLS